MPFVGIGIIVGHQIVGGNGIVDAYIARVVADGGYYEGITCLTNAINAL